MCETNLLHTENILRFDKENILIQQFPSTQNKYNTKLSKDD